MTFRPTHPGKKTARMLQVEAEIGRTLEEDYNEHYLQKGWGQKRLADRWDVKRGMIFESSERNRSRSWVEMLGLPVRRTEEAAPPPFAKRPQCEACGEASTPLEKAHWIEASKRGPRSYDNIVLLCPNCHTRLDQLHDSATTERVGAVLLHRAAKTCLATEQCSAEQFLTLCKQIIGGRPT